MSQMQIGAWLSHDFGIEFFRVNMEQFYVNCMLYSHFLFKLELDGMHITYKCCKDHIPVFLRVPFIECWFLHRLLQRLVNTCTSVAAHQAIRTTSIFTDLTFKLWPGRSCQPNLTLYLRAGILFTASYLTVVLYNL